MFEMHSSQAVGMTFILGFALLILLNLGFILYEKINGRTYLSDEDKSSADGLPEDAESGESDNS